MKHLFTIILLGIGFCANAQNNPAPAYLTTQKLPDSVLTMPLHTLPGDTLPFSEVLNKHKGKKLVIDIWASWCGDCIKGLPALYRLKEKTKNEPVDYVYISVDKEEGRWKKAIDRFEMKGEHYRSTTDWENPFNQYIDLDWIPRYLVLDEEGNIIVPKAIKASDQALKEVLFKK